MRLSVIQAQNVARSLIEPPQLILLGLGVVIAGLLWPSTPVTGAMALICLGATLATAERFRRHPARGLLLAAQLVVYGSLYLLFVGATLDAAGRSGAGLSPLAALDLAASLGPTAAAVAVLAQALSETHPA
jgi:predicted permease